jgi:hypothetical protein
MAQHATASWDGKNWISADGAWVWKNAKWLRARSDLPLIVRLAIYICGAIGVFVELTIVLGLAWGLTGPGWDLSPPDMAWTVVQLFVTAVCAVAGFWLAWFLIRIDRRDWWLGLLVASPWALAAGALLLNDPGATSGVILSMCFVGAAALQLSGSIVGRWSLWPYAERPHAEKPDTKSVSSPGPSLVSLIGGLLRAAANAVDVVFQLPRNR